MSTIIRFSTILFLLTAAACAPDPRSFGAFPAADDEGLTSAVSKEEATSIGQLALEGMNARSFDLFSTRWDKSMRDAISEGAWLQFRDPFMQKYGAFQELEETRMNAGDGGHVRFSMLARFENGYVTLIHSYPVDGTSITGAFFRNPETGGQP